MVVTSSVVVVVACVVVVVGASVVVSSTKTVQQINVIYEFGVDIEKHGIFRSYLT